MSLKNNIMETKLFGKCLMAQPDQKDGVQNSFTNSMGMTTFDYFIKMEVDGKMYQGKYSSKTPHLSPVDTQKFFVVGQSRLFNYEEKSMPKKDGGTWIKKTIKPEREQASTFTSAKSGISVNNTAYNDPKEIAQISMSMNQDNAIQAYIGLKKEPLNIPRINTMALLFHNWTVDVKPLDRGVVVRRAYCIKNAIISMINFKSIEVKPEMIDATDNTKKTPAIKGISSSEHIISIAEQLYMAQVKDEIYKVLIPEQPKPQPQEEEKVIVNPTETTSGYTKEKEIDLPF